MNNVLPDGHFHRSHFPYLLVQLFSGVAIALLLVLAFRMQWFPPPGVAVAVVALLAAAMSIHNHMRGSHKAVWMILMGAFLSLEMVAIVHERKVQAEQQKTALREEREQFARIGKELENSISTSQTEFNETMLRSDRLLKSVTGGDSYAVLLPYTPYQGKELPLFVENRGPNTLSGVTVTIHSQGAWTPGMMELLTSENDKRVVVGTLASKERQLITARLLPDSLMTGNTDTDGRKIHTAFVLITAQNFSVEEYLFLKQVPGDQWQKEKWVYRYMVFRDMNTKKRQTLEETDWSDDVNQNRQLVPHAGRRPYR